jgi:hypothetical protein
MVAVIWLVASAIAMLYPRTEELPGAEDCDLVPFLRGFCSDAPRPMWIGVVLGAIVFHLAPLFTVYVPLPAFLLPRTLRDRHAQRISTSSLYLVRQSIMLLKLPAGMCWGAHPSVRAKLALPPLPRDPDQWRSA